MFPGIEAMAALPYIKVSGIKYPKAINIPAIDVANMGFLLPILVSKSLAAISPSSPFTTKVIGI